MFIFQKAMMSSQWVLWKSLKQKDLSKMSFLEAMTEGEDQITSMMLTINLSVETITMCVNKESHLHIFPSISLLGPINS